MASWRLRALYISSESVLAARQSPLSRVPVFAATALFCAIALLPAGAQTTTQTPTEVFASGGTPAEEFSGGGAPETYSDQASTSCIQGEPPNVYKQVGMNPLVCYGVSAPEDSNKQCTLAGMKVLAHQGETCYYCQAINPPTNGIIVPIDQIEAATRQGFDRCGADQVDLNCMAICTKTGSLSYTPPAGTTRVVTPGPPAGSKGMVRDAGPNTPDTPADLALVVKTMTTCLQAKLPYKLNPVESSWLTLANYALSKPTQGAPTPVAQQPASAQVMLEAWALQEQAQNQHDQLYGKDAYNAGDSEIFLMGWLVRCLADAGVDASFTQSPFVAFSKYMGTPGNISTNHTDALFSQGYYYNSMGINPLPLMAVVPGAPAPDPLGVQWSGVPVK